MFPYRFSGENQETLLKTQGITPKTFQIWKKLKDLKKTQGYEALLGLLGLKKVYKKQACTRRTFDLAAMLEDRGLVNKRMTIKSIFAMIVFKSLGTFCFETSC